MYISANISYKGNSADIDFPVSDEMLNDILIESKMPTDTTQRCFPGARYDFGDPVFCQNRQRVF